MKKGLIRGVIAAIIIIVVFLYSGYLGTTWWHGDAVTKWMSAIGVPFSILFSSYTIYRSRKSEKHQGLLDIFFFY
jgi:TRAP-type C4-dicarboxylate transport system permease small subunit